MYHGILLLYPISAIGARKPVSSTRGARAGCVFGGCPLATSSCSIEEGSPLLAACLFGRILQLQFVDKFHCCPSQVLRPRNCTLLATNLGRDAEWPWLRASSGLCSALCSFCGFVPVCQCCARCSLKRLSGYIPVLCEGILFLGDEATVEKNLPWLLSFLTSEF